MSLRPASLDERGSASASGQNHGAGERPSAVPLLAGATIAVAAAEIAARRGVGAGEPFATVRRSVAINANPAQVFALLDDPQTVGRLVEPSARLQEISPNRWEWAVSGPFGSEVSLRSVLTDVRPGKRIAWRAGNGAIVPHDVALDVMDAPDGEGTVVRAAVALYPSSKLPLVGTRSLIEKATDRTLASALYRLRALLETGEIPTVEGQPSGLGEGRGKEHDHMASEERGLGKLVYGAETHAEHADETEMQAGGDLVEEASEESFPASDPPVFSRGTVTPTPDAEEPGASPA